MTNPEILLGFFRKHPVFAECTQDTLCTLLSAPGALECAMPAGNELPVNRFALLLSGRASVYSKDNGRRLLLRSLKAGDFFGVTAIFSAEKSVSRLLTITDCLWYLPDCHCLQQLLQKDDALMLAYVRYLSDRIRFLNEKIIYLTAGSAERRLARYLDTCAQGNDSFVLPLSARALSEFLDVSRATLYRAFDRLCADGFLRRDGRTYSLLNRQAMLDRYQ